ncbi:MAG: purine-binding chemotaxis protein CheW [Myxococcales bacterium]|nr:purine-binding chemotaxis protein CheW [Myxococcales bacterium]
MAPEHHPESPTQPPLKLVTFDVGGRSLGAPITQVRETVEMRPVTPVFGTPPAIIGLMSLRGEILAVLDVAALLGYPPARRDPTSRLLVADVGHAQAAILVDQLGPLHTVTSDAIATAPDTLPEEEGALLLGVVSRPERPLPVLDLARVLAAPPLRAYLGEEPPRSHER